jgi:hypothetical protein
VNNEYFVFLNMSVTIAVALGLFSYRVCCRRTFSFRPLPRSSTIIAVSASLAIVIPWSVVQALIPNLPKPFEGLAPALTTLSYASLLLAALFVGFNEGFHHSDASHREYLLGLYRELPEDGTWVPVAKLAESMHATTPAERDRLLRAIVVGAQHGFLDHGEVDDEPCVTLSIRSRWQILAAETALSP